VPRADQDAYGQILLALRLLEDGSSRFVAVLEKDAR
jgi:hypothetical protein